MKGRVRAATAVLAVLIILAAVVRANSYSLALLAGGYQEEKLVSEGFLYSGNYPRNIDPRHWRVSLTQKDGGNRLVLMERGFLGFWGMPQAAEDLAGELAGLEHIHVFSPAAPYTFYGYDPTADPSSMVRDNTGLGEVYIQKMDLFYHGANAFKTLDIPEDALPRDCTVQIVQSKEEYVLHLCLYAKGSGSFGEDIESIYKALVDNGCIRS